MTLSSPSWSSAGSAAAVSCARFDETLSSWTVDGVTTQLHPGGVSCASKLRRSSYALFRRGSEEATTQLGDEKNEGFGARTPMVTSTARPLVVVSLIWGASLAL